MTIVNKVKPELFPYQKIGVDYLLRNQRCLLADEMGLGKSAQASKAVEKLHKESGRDKTNVLIVCPASLCLMWECEIKKWIIPSNFTCTIVHLRDFVNPVTLRSNVRFVIISYNFLQKPDKVERLCKLKWNVIIADEFANCKNWNAKQTKGFVAVTKNSSANIWLMTGTPATKSAQDYYTYLEIIQPGKNGSYREHSENYCEKKRNWYTKKLEYKGIKPGKALELQGKFSWMMLRRLKKDVLKELPEKIVQRLPIEVSLDLLAGKLKISKELVKLHIREGKPFNKHIAEVVQAIGLAKVPAAIEWIKSCGEPCVVFCNHVEVLNQIESGVSAHKKVGRVTGKESKLAKNMAVESFQAGNLDVILMNSVAGSTGYTLTKASHMLIVELPWSPAIRSQMWARIDRIGTKVSPHIVEMVAVGTIDDYIMEALEMKQEFMQVVMGDV